MATILILVVSPASQTATFWYLLLVPPSVRWLVPSPGGLRLVYSPRGRLAEKLHTSLRLPRSSLAEVSLISGISECRRSTGRNPTTMHFPRGKDRLRLALPTTTVPAIPYSTPNEYLFFLIPPSSLIECVPTNITWTGGMAPYSLQINLGASSAMIRLFDNILNSNFVWDTDAAAGTAVSLQVVDARTVQVALEPITVGAGPNSSCVQGTITLPPPSPSLRTAPISGVSAYTPYIGPSPSSIPSTVLYWSPPRTSTLTSQTTLAPPPTSPAWYTDRQTTQKVSSLNGASSAGLAVGIVSFLTFSVWSWLRFRKRNMWKGANDKERQEATGQGDQFEAAITLWGDDESTTTGTSDDQPEDIAAANPSNETRNDAPAEDQALISTATPASVPEVPTQADNSSATPQLTTPRIFSSRRTKRLQTPRLFSTAQSSSDAGTISDTGAARFSSSTASGSTAPPSYRTRQSSVYTPPPPPAYTAANLPPPPGPFRMPGRARRGWLPTSSKLAQGRENAAASAVRGRTVTQDRSEGTSTREERHLGPSGLDSKRAPPTESRGDRAAFSDTADSVSETGATIRSGDRDD